MSIENPFDLRLPVDMAKLAEQVGIYKATKNSATTFYFLTKNMTGKKASRI
ncbi:hypothetical protein [Yersinia enterocolitica]|uniref:hypothetical protein n=1 Tax=Yersinia enterocolitica TaxID=630 RepID=UPI000ACB12BA